MSKKKSEKQKEKIFISYARKDNENNFVNRLHKYLSDRARDLDVWIDTERMLSNGQPWRQQIRDRIKASDRIIAVIGPHALKSTNVWYEWEHGYLFSKALIPILVKGEYGPTLEKLIRLNSPEFFQKHPTEFIPKYILDKHCISFVVQEKEDPKKAKKRYDKALSDLWKSLKEKITLGPLKGEIIDTPRFIPRPKALIGLSNLVLADLKESAALKSDEKVIGIHGRGGLGKTVLARAFASSVETRRIFTDGIVWLDVGQRPDRVKCVRVLGTSFKDRDSAKIFRKITDLDDAKKKLRDLLDDKNCLLILDDVWDGSEVEYFKSVLGENCRLIFTTRDARCINELAARPFSLEKKSMKLTENQALRLLADWSQTELEDLPEEASKVAKVCGNLPLALAICGALAAGRGGRKWSQILSDVKKAKTYMLKRKLHHYSNKQINTFSPLQVSLNYLKEIDKEERRTEGLCLERHRHYLETAAFGSGTFTPESVVLGLWASRSNFEESDLGGVLGLLIDRALVRLKEEEEEAEFGREVSLHSLQQVYLANILGKKQITSLHKDIGKALLNWWEKNKDRNLKNTEEVQTLNYIMDYLIHHLVEGVHYKGLKHLLTDIQYLERLQKEGRQYKFQHDFTSLLENLPQEREQEIESILLSIHNKVEAQRLSRKKADWLDTFAYWLTVFVDKNESASVARKSKLKSISNEFDKSCAKVSEDLAEKYEKEAKLTKGDRKNKKYDYCMRFAELYTWVCQRSENFDKCIEACEFAERLCGRAGIPVAYRNLGSAEFIRMRAYTHKRLAKGKEKTLHLNSAYKAYNDLNRKFSSNIWTPDIKEWEKLEGDKGKVLRPPTQKYTNRTRKGVKKQKVLKARIVSNAHDCIGAIHIIRFFLKKGGQVEWIHHKKFESKQLTSGDVLFTVLLGGPKAPEISDVAYEFYKFSKKNEKTYLRMYSGMYIEANCLDMEKDGTHCYMLGGISKLNTLMAAYEFTKNAKVMKIIKKQK